MYSVICFFISPNSVKSSNVNFKVINIKLRLNISVVDCVWSQPACICTCKSDIIHFYSYSEHIIPRLSKVMSYITDVFFGIPEGFQQKVRRIINWTSILWCRFFQVHVLISVSSSTLKVYIVWKYIGLVMDTNFSVRVKTY